MCTFAAVGMIATIASSGLSMAGAIMQGNQAQAAANAQAAALEQQRQAEAQAAAFEASQEHRKQQLHAADARAQVGASGVAFQGSPTQALVANAGQGQLDIEAIRWGSQIRQNTLRTQADLARMQGKQAKQASFINAGSSFISGVSSLYDPNRAVAFGRSPFAGGLT